jgi:hypothetical protein
MSNKEVSRFQSSNATSVKQDLLLAELKLKTDLTEIQPISITGPVTVSGPLTDVQLRANPVPITGSNLATSTKQDLLLTELQLKAGLTETQPVEISTNSTIISLLEELISEQKITNKLLTKIYQ